MATFKYKGLLEGKEVSGTLKASSYTEAIQKLEHKGILPLEVKELKEKTLRGFHFNLSFLREKVSDEDLAFVLYQISTLLEAGLPLPRVLELVAKQTENSKISTALLQIKQNIESGMSISKAFKEAQIFPDFFVEMLSAAQTGENLEFLFKIAADYLNRIAEIKSRIISSITYPSFVIGFSFLAVIVAVKFVVPKLLSILESFGKKPPLITELIVFFTNLVIYTVPLLVLTLLLAPFWKKRLFSPESFGKLLLKLPVIGSLILYLNLARFSKTLSMLLKVSTPLPHALELAAKSLSNPFLRKEFESLVPSVEKGKSLSKLLKEKNFLPPLFVNLIETGESGGELEKMLDLISQTFEKEVFRKIDFWLRMVEPISILLIALVVGIVAVSIILPMSQLTAGVH